MSVDSQNRNATRRLGGTKSELPRLSGFAPTYVSSADWPGQQWPGQLAKTGLTEPVGQKKENDGVLEQSRAYAELLQEIRIAQNVSQAVLAFQLSIGFTNRFAELAFFERGLYVCLLIVSIVALALLVTPAVFRQMTSHRHGEYRLAAATKCVLAGIALLMCSIAGSLWLTLYVVFSFQLALVIALTIFLWFVILWFVYPVYTMVKKARSGAAEVRQRTGK